VCALLDGPIRPGDSAEADATALKKIEAVTALRKPTACAEAGKRHEQVECEQHDDQADGRGPTGKGDMEPSRELTVPARETAGVCAPSRVSGS
jgi:hypothetical protein